MIIILFLYAEAIEKRDSIKEIKNESLYQPKT